MIKFISFPGLKDQGFPPQAFNRFTLHSRGSLKPYFAFIARTKVRGFGKAVIKSWWFIPLIIGLILRLVLSSISFHSDLYSLNFSSYLFSYKGVINIYDYLANLPQDSNWASLYSREFFTYPPLAYFTLGTFMFLSKLFINTNFINFFVSNYYNLFFGDSELFRHLLIIKLPYIIFDLAIARLLFILVKDESYKKLAFILWMFNPLSLYTNYIIGQFDIIPVFFIVLSFYLAKINRKNLALVSLGIGGGFKLFPLFLVPIFAFVLGEGFRNRVKLLILGFAPYLLVILPFISSSAFRQNVLFSNQSQKMLFMSWYISGGEVIYVFILALTALYLCLYYKKVNIDDLLTYTLVLLLLLFSVTHYHPQWFLWITPFLVLELCLNRFKHLLIVSIMFISWFVTTLFFESSLTYGAFAPIFPQLREAKGLSEIFGNRFELPLFKSMIRSVFAGTSITYIFRLLSSKTNEG